jgi:hypothetical protein
MKLQTKTTGVVRWRAMGKILKSKRLERQLLQQGTLGVQKKLVLLNIERHQFARLPVLPLSAKYNPSC